MNDRIQRPQVVVPESAIPVQNAFIARVFLWMTLGLLVTAAGALVTIATPSLLRAIATIWWLWLAIAAIEIALVVVLTRSIGQLSFGAALAGFVSYAALNGVTLSIILLIYTESSVVEVFGLTAITFGVMAAFGYLTKRDLTRLGNLLFMALVGLILASLLNLLLRSSAIYWITTFAGVLIFVGLVAYDTQKIKRLSVIAIEHPDLARRVAIVAALALYLDFINLFLFLLRIFGRRR